MITDKKGETALSDLEPWANRVSAAVDKEVHVSASYDGDSNTYVMRLAKGRRVLLFRLSEAQVQNAEREHECEKTLKKKIIDLST
ncbi:MAG TPA: hypothetical protein VGR30_04535 [Candidatus Binatia bacterium]|jgi:3-phosphoglycerate kinase|nr:hypothetical protein [Candidatus Binatia bacterium]